MKKNSLPYNNNQDFKVPQGYFESLEDRVMDAVATDEIEQSLPEHGFVMSSGYSESFEDRLFNRMKQENLLDTEIRPKTRRLHIRESLKYVAAVAAVVLVVGTLFNSNEPTASDNLESIDLLTLQGYLQEVSETPNSNLQFIITEQQDSLGAKDDIIIEQEALLEYLKENIDEPSILYYEN